MNSFLTEISISFKENEEKPSILQGVALARSSVPSQKKKRTYFCTRCKKVPTYDIRGICQKCLVKVRTEDAKTHDFKFSRKAPTSKGYKTEIEACPKSNIFGHHWMIEDEKGICKFCSKEKEFKRRMPGVWTKTSVS